MFDIQFTPGWPLMLFADYIYERLNEVNSLQTEADEGVQKQFADLGSLTKVTTPAEFSDFLTEIDDTWRPVVQTVNANR